MRTLCLLALLILLAGCATNPVTGEQDLVMMSEQDELKLGAQTNQRILQQYQPYDDPDLQAYVQYVGTKLAAISHRSHLNFRFTVLDSKEVNAFALPGGYIYITRGLMAYLNSEAELAAVLGHEIGHVTARHAVRQHSATQLANIGLVLSSVFLPGGFQTAGQQLGNLLGGALLSGYGREHELQSDRLGAEYLAGSGYDPQAMLQVIRVLKNQEQFELKLARAESRQANVYHGLFASHPDNDTRLQQVIAHAAQVKQVDTPYTGRDAYLTRIDELSFGESTQQGILRGQNFYHGDLGFTLQFPAGWKVDNRTDSLIAAAPDNSAIMQLTLKPVGQRISPRAFMLGKLGLKQLNNEQSLKIHGLPAHTATAVIDASGTQRLSRITVIYYQQHAYILVGMSKDPGNIARHDGSFLITARSFRPLTGDERETIRPMRLEIIRADDKMTYATLATNSPLENFAEQQIRLLNGDYPAGEPQVGELVKIVR